MKINSRGSISHDYRSSKRNSIGEVDRLNDFRPVEKTVPDCVEKRKTHLISRERDRLRLSKPKHHLESL